MQPQDQLVAPVDPKLREKALQQMYAQKHNGCHGLNEEGGVSLWQTKLQLKYQKLLYKLQDVYIQINEFLEASKDYHTTQQQREELLEHKRTLLLRETQIFMVLFLIQNHSKPDFEQAYNKSFQSLDRLKIPYKLLKQRPLNYFILEDLFEMEFNYNNQYQRTIRALHAAAQKSQKDFRDALKKSRVMISKITTMIEGFASACLFPLDDLFSQPRLTSPRWEAMKPVMRLLVLADKKKVQESFDSVRNKLVFTTAALNKFKNMKNKGGIVSAVRGAYDIFKYAFSKEKAKWRAELCIANPDGRFMKEMWNLPQIRVFRPFVDLIMPRIKYSEAIHIKRIVRPITADRVYAWEQQHDYGITDEFLKDISGLDQNPPTSFAQLFNPPSSDDISNEKIHVIINSPIELKQKGGGQSFFNRWLGSSCPSIDTIIFHIHGGGFISMTPYIHQVYIRKWANNTGVPIFSIDYRKSPEYAFPQGLDDCFQCYVWMILYLQKMFDLTLKKIIIIGDSAGANLGMAMINLAIKFQIRVPDALFMIYPALSLEDNKYTPSIMRALEDLILPHTFLKICQRSYLQDERMHPEFDPLISPIHTSNSFLNVYPPVRIYVGNMDPFHDDCCRLTQKLLKLNKDVRLTVLDSFPHGFLQFDIPPEGNEFSKTAITEIEKELKCSIQM